MCLTKYGKKTMFTAKTTSNGFEFPPTHTTYCIYWVALQVQMDSKVDLPRCDDFFLCIENDTNFIMLIFALPELRFNRLYNT